MKGSAVIYDTLYIILIGVISLIFVLTIPKGTEIILKLLEKASADVVVLDITGMISSLQTFPGTAKLKYCFPSKFDYELKINEREVVVKLITEEGKCTEEYCEGRDYVPAKVLTNVHFSTDESNRCIIIEKSYAGVSIFGE
ncbi:MAG: hypothetical protein J7L39_02420 [Candidatus Aenigmarchaeota archaeon]|nr:hypothetical protein [Candidatus Aenigmarchaeota archaeon]